MLRDARPFKPAERGGRTVTDTVILDYAQRSAADRDRDRPQRRLFRDRARTNRRGCAPTISLLLDDGRWSKWWRRLSR